MDDPRHAKTVLADAFDRVRQQVTSVTDGAGTDVLAYRPDAAANTVAWLVWHLIRVQDTHLADLTGEEPVWQADGWVDRFDLSLDPDDTGYGASTAEVAALDGVSVDHLTGYHRAVDARTTAYLDGLSGEELERVVDDSYDTPVTTAARLVSVIGDCLAHLGQAAYVRGLAERADGSRS